MPELKVSMYGALRKYANNGGLVVACELPLAASALKLRIADEIKKSNPSFCDDVLRESALAHASRLLSEEELILTAENIAVLPPVCGG